MLNECFTHTIIHEKAIPWLKTKVISSSVLEVENLHGEESYPVSLMEVELPRVGGNNVKIKAYAVNQKFPVMVPNRNLIQKLWPNLDSKLKHEILQNAYEGETHIIIGQDNYWAMVDNVSGLENLISHENNLSGLLRTKFGWSVSGNLSNNPGWPQTLSIYPIKSINCMQKIEDTEKSLTESFNRNEDLTNESGIPPLAERSNMQ